MRKTMHTIYGVWLMLMVFTLSSMSASASLMPLQMLSHDSSMAEVISQPHQTQLHHDNITQHDDCCSSDMAANSASCVVSCAVFSACLLARPSAQMLVLPRLALIIKETRVQARTVAPSVYRPPIV